MQVIASSQTKEPPPGHGLVPRRGRRQTAGRNRMAGGLLTERKAIYALAFSGL